MTTTHRPLPDVASPSPERRRRWPYFAIAAAASLLAVVLVVTRDADDPTVPLAEQATTTTSAAPTSTAAAALLDESLAAFPAAGSDARYGTPDEVARAFAIDLGFEDPLVGDYRAGDSRSGEIDVQPVATGPITTVLVRQLAANEDWWVMGTATGAIQVERPGALDPVASPVRLTGISTAFEATVDVAVWEDGTDEPIGRGWVMGGANGEMAPFDGSIDIRPPTAPFGTIVLSTLSMENGQTWEASTFRVRFAAPTPCGGLPAPAPPTEGEMTVRVFYTCAETPDAAPIALTRAVPGTTEVVRASLDALLAGPTEAELAAGFTSWFSGATAGMVRRVTISDYGDAAVDFADLRTVIPNASASAGSQLLLAQLDATVLQHPNVRSVVYEIDGECGDFFEWLQLAGCEHRDRQS